MTKKSRLITGLLAAVLAAVMLSSAVYIAVEANHNCSGEDCAICHQLQACENLLKSMGLAGAAAVFAAAVRYAPCRVILLRGGCPHVYFGFAQGQAFRLNKNDLQGCSLSVFG